MMIYVVIFGNIFVHSSIQGAGTITTIDILNNLSGQRFHIKNAAKRTRQHAGEKNRNAEYVQRRVFFINEQVP